MNDVACMAVSSCSKADEERLVDEYFKVSRLLLRVVIAFANVHATP